MVSLPGSIVLFLGFYAQAPESKPIAPAVEEIRATARALLQSLCATQCDVVDVRIKTKPAAPVGAVAPGFDDTPPLRQIPSSIELDLLFDKGLEPEFRRFASERVRHRIGEFGLPVNIAERTIPFPELPAPKEPKVTEPEPAAAAAPAPLIIQPAMPAVPPTLAEAKDPWAALIFRLIEALPLLLLALLLAAVIVWTVRRLENARNDPQPEVESEDNPLAQTVVTASPAAEKELIPAPELQALKADLTAHRHGTRRVFARMLARGDTERVAKAVAVLGDFILRDLLRDPSAADGLAELDQRAFAPMSAAIDVAERDQILRAIQAEALADRATKGHEDVRSELEELLGFGPESFAALMERVDDRLQILLLRHAPLFLSETHLLGLSEADRAQRVKKLLLSPASAEEELATLKEAMQTEQKTAELVGAEMERAVELLDTLSPEAQEEMVRALEERRPEIIGRHRGRLPIESSLLSASEHALSRAWAQVPVAAWIEYLRSADERIRQRALAACPARLREGVVEELKLRVAADPTRAQDARRAILRAVLKTAPERGNGASGRPLASDGRAAQNRGSKEESKR